MRSQNRPATVVGIPAPHRDKPPLPPGPPPVGVFSLAAAKARGCSSDEESSRSPRPKSRPAGPADGGGVIPMVAPPEWVQQQAAARASRGLPLRPKAAPRAVKSSSPAAPAAGPPGPAGPASHRPSSRTAAPQAPQAARPGPPGPPGRQAPQAARPGSAAAGQPPGSAAAKAKATAPPRPLASAALRLSRRASAAASRLGLSTRPNGLGEFAQIRWELGMHRRQLLHHWRTWQKEYRVGRMGNLAPLRG